MTITAVAWDVDGTLVDSEPLHHRALLAVCAHYGVDVSDIPESRFCGVHINDVWLALRHLMPPQLEASEWLDGIEAYYIAHSDSLVAIPGGKHTILTLAKQGIRQGCVSNYSRRIVTANLQALGVLEHMEFLVTLDDVSTGKPAAEPYQRALSLFGLSADEVLAVEDSVTGVTAGLAAGLSVAGFTPDTPLHPGCITVHQLSDILALVTGETR